MKETTVLNFANRIASTEGYVRQLLTKKRLDAVKHGYYVYIDLNGPKTREYLAMRDASLKAKGRATEAVS